MEEIADDLIDMVDTLHPFGQGNPEPIFGIKGFCMQTQPRVFGNGHFSFTIPIKNRRELKAVAWRQAENMPPIGQDIDIAVRLSWSNWNGRRYPQVELVDWRGTQ